MIDSKLSVSAQEYKRNVLVIFCDDADNTVYTS